MIVERNASGLSVALVRSSAGGHLFAHIRFFEVGNDTSIPVSKVALIPNKSSRYASYGASHGNLWHARITARVPLGPPGLSLVLHLLVSRGSMFFNIAILVN